MDPDKQFIIEYQTVGNSTKVTAIDPETMREVSVITPSATPRADMVRLAVRKLKYVLDKES